MLLQSHAEVMSIPAGGWPGLSGGDWGTEDGTVTASGVSWGPVSSWHLASGGRLDEEGVGQLLLQRQGIRGHSLSDG